MTGDDFSGPGDAAGDGRTTPEPIRVGIADDQPLLVSAFRALIDNEPGLVVGATAADGHEAVAMCAEHDLDVVLMDIRMPRLDGIEATRRIAAAGDRPRVLVLTTFDVDEFVLGAVGAGARGFLLKDADPADVLGAVRAVHRGEAVIAHRAAPALLAELRRLAGPERSDETGTGSRDAVEGLTPREIEVLTLVGRGATNAEIADELFIAPTTVKTHVGNLLLKLSARDRVALVVLAHGVGLVGGAATHVRLP